MTKQADVAEVKADPNVILSDQVRATIARGETAFKKSMVALPMTNAPRVIVSIIDPKDQARREDRLEAIRQQAAGRRGQPPMVDRLSVVAIYVDHLERQGVRFATARRSQINQKVRKWLNERMAKSQDGRKSRRKVITADAVKDLLKEVAELRK